MNGEQANNQPGAENTKKPESNEKLKMVIQTLEETATEFKRLDKEAHVHLSNHKYDDCEKKMTEKAQLLINLPSKISLEGIEENIKEEISQYTSHFALQAEKAIGETFLLEVLLMDQNMKKMDDKNHLEKLIEKLKQHA